MFDTSKVKALQEDRTNQWKRADEGYKARIINRNEARIEKGLPPLEDNDPLGLEYYQTAMTQTSMSTQDDLDEPNLGKTETDVEVAGQNLVKVENEDEKDEEKKFRAFAKRRLKENKSQDIGEYEFLHLSQNKQRKLLSEFGVPDPDAELVLKGLLEVVNLIKNKESVE
jgi:hypothetical protein